MFCFIEKWKGQILYFSINIIRLLKKRVLELFNASHSRDTVAYFHLFIFIYLFLFIYFYSFIFIYLCFFLNEKRLSVTRGLHVMTDAMLDQNCPSPLSSTCDWVWVIQKFYQSASTLESIVKIVPRLSITLASSTCVSFWSSCFKIIFWS